MAKLVVMPTEPDKLREMLEALKDKESRLEADLAIRERPELEEAIMILVIAMTDVRTLNTALKITTRPAVDNSADIIRLQKVVKFYEGKLETAKAQLKDVSAGVDTKFIRMRSQRELACSKLNSHVDMWADTFAEREIDLNELIPSLKALCSSS